MPAYPGFIGGSYPALSVMADAERTINLAVETIESEGATHHTALIPSPGFAQWSRVNDVGGRALKVADGRLFGVIGGRLWEFDSNGTATDRGAVAQNAYPAQIIYNGKVGGQIGIATGGNVYAFDLATNTLSGPYLGGLVTQIAYAAGFGLAFNINTGKVQISALNDLTTWSAGIFFQRSLFGDPYQAMFVDANNLVWLIGTETYEVRYNTGIGTQPFAPLSGLVGSYGIAAPFAFGQSPLGNAWLTKNGQGGGEFVVTRGGSPESIQTYGVSNVIAGYLRTSTIDNAEVLMYQMGGHTYGVVSFPAVPATWCVDLQSHIWTELGRWNPALGRYELWSPRVQCFAFGTHLVGDRTTGVIARMDTDLATEIDGAGIRRLRRAPAIVKEHRRIPIDRLELLMDVGIAGQGVDPMVLLRVSRDGGRTWGNEQQAGFGRIGEYGRQVYWNRLGASPNTVFEVTVSDPVPVRIADAWLNNLEQVA